MRVLHIDCSSRVSGSSSRRLSARFMDRLAGGGVDLDVDRLDLAASPPQHFGRLQTAAIYVMETERTPEMAVALAESDALCARVLEADALVCGIPMYNFGMPSVFKVFVDNVIRSERTFDITEGGVIGHLAGKKAAFLLSTGGNYKPGGMFNGMDCLTPHLKTVFAFAGLTTPDIVHAQPTQFEGPDAKEKALARAEAAVDALADAWARGHAPGR